MPDSLDYPAPLDRSSMLTALCHSLGALAERLDPFTPPEVLTVLGDSARAAQVLAMPDPSAAPALDFMTARMTAAGLELYPAQTLAQFRAEAQRLDALRDGAGEALRRVSTGQARELLAQMLSAGQLPVPPELNTATPEQVAASLTALGAVLSEQAAAWGQNVEEGSAEGFFSHALTCAGEVFTSVLDLGRSPLDSLAVFATWAAAFMRELLETEGLDPAPMLSATESGTFGEVLSLGVLLRLPDDRARGAFMAGLGVYYAAADALAVSSSPDDLRAFILLAGASLAGASASGGLSA